ncbi:hypothetical protein ACFPFV_00165 [Salinicoccus siamensis]|uniref:hypothetical protein n=1 Tax=Salinicoccus siamensis TaxID=381830 RepID=UPI003614133F
MMHLLNRYDEISGLDKAEEGPLEDFMLDMIRVHTEEDPLITDTHRDKMMINMKRFMSDDDMRQLLDDSLEIIYGDAFHHEPGSNRIFGLQQPDGPGIVDVLLEMEEGYVIIDYKTDRLRPGDEVDDLIDRYRTQMDIYRRSIMQALSKMLLYTYISLSMERLKLMTDNMRARSILGFALLLALLMNGLYFMMPYDAVNPYEYLHGINLSTFLALDIFIGGAVVPLIALVGGYLIHSYSGIGVGNLAKVLGFLLALGIVHTFFVHAFDFLPDWR